MVKFILGVIFGIAIGAVFYLVSAPKISDKSYSNGYEKGVVAGSAKGMEECLTRQKKISDSIAAANKMAEAILSKKTIRKTTEPYKNPNDINYTVEGNQIKEERK